MPKRISPAQLALLKVDFLAAVAGRSIVDIEVRATDCLGDAPDDGEVILEALILDNGTRIELTASAQIDYDDVWARAIPAKRSNG